MAEASVSLAKEPQVISLDPQFVGDVLEDIRTVGRATGTLDKAEVIAGKMQSRIDAVAARAQAAATRPRVLSLEWIEPLIYAGHWIPEMVEMAGGRIASAARTRARGPWSGVTWWPANRRSSFSCPAGST